MSVNTEHRQPKDLNEAWENARKAFLDRTKIELYPESQQTLDSVLRSLDAKYNPEPDKAAAIQTKKRVRDNVIKVFSVVNVLGSVSAQGASIVFGPAGTCFNAIALLLDAPGKIVKVYDGLADLFEEVAHFMTRFHVLEQIDAEGLLDEVLIENSNNILIKLVDICGLMISLIRKSSWNKFKTGLKAALIDDDSGVQEALESFRRLADRQSSIIQDFNLYHAARTDASIGRLEPKVELVWEDINRRRNKEISKERLRSLAIKLNVPLEALDDLTASPQTTLHDTARRLFPGSQDWLSSLIPYVEWKKSQPGLHRLLHVSAEPQCGKSFFLASVFSDALGSDADLLVGHYSYGQSSIYTAQPDEVTGSESLLALKAVSLQLAQVNSDYAANLESALSEAPLLADENIKIVWDRLFAMTGKSKSSTKVLMLFDNVDELPVDACEEFMSMIYEKCDKTLDGNNLDMWTMTAARPRMLRQMSARSFNQLNIQEHSSSLIDKHISRATEAHATLRQPHPGILRLKSEVRNRLPRLAQGDFGFINKRIDTIVECINSGEDSLDTLLSIVSLDPAAEQGQAIQQLLKNLEQSLNPGEVDHLNVLLQWTMYGGRKLTLEQLEQAIFLSSDTTHLLPLEGKVRHRYSDIFSVDDGRVSVKDDVASYLKATSTNRQISDQKSAKISLTIKIEDASSTEVKRFLWKLNDSLSNGDLQLDFTPQQVKNHRAISVSSSEAYATLTSQCLQLLTNDEAGQQHETLITYALQQLPHLLGELRTVSEAGQLSSVTKQVVLQRLINLLRDTESWVRHFRTRGDTNLWLAWIMPIKVLDDLQYWLTETEALHRVEPVHRRWSKSLMTLDKAPGSFWRPFTVEVARMWLRERNTPTEVCWLWVESFLEMQNGTQTGYKSGGPDYWHPRIHAAATWSQQALSLQTLDSLYFERVGYAFLDGIRTNMVIESKKRWSQAAIDQFNQATAYPSYSWKVDRGIAMVNNHVGDNKGAMDSMSKGILKLQASIQVDGQNKEEQESLLAELKTLALWRATAGDHKHASSLYDEVLDIKPDDYGCHWRRFQSLCQANEHQRARVALTDLARKEGKQKGVTQLAESLHRLITGALDSATVSDDVTKSLLTVVKDGDLRAQVLSAIHDNLIYAQHQKRPFDQAKMLLLQGILLAQSADSDSERATAQQSWRKCILLCEGHSNLAKWLSVYRLALRYEGTYHLNRLIHSKASIEAADVDSHLYYLNRIAKAATSAYGRPHYGPATYLAAYHWLNGRVSMARKVLQPDLQRAMEILSDHDHENDYIGYKILAYTLNHAGDPLNALSAWSFFRPRKTSPSKGKATKTLMSHYCDGMCGKKWSYADDMWVCKYCPGTDFCTPCKQKLQQGKLERFWCSPTHDWLHVPPAADLESDPVPQDHVRIGGRMQGDKRVGGEVVEIKVWLDKLRQEWKESIAEVNERSVVEDDHGQIN